MSFAVFASEKSGYYDQINAMRRFLKLNYEIPAGFAFLSANGPKVRTFSPGYVLEARIPWKVLGVRGPVKPGMVFGIDVHFSDSDNAAVQESMTSLNPIPWQGRRQENILKMVLTGTDGKLPR